MYPFLPNGFADQTIPFLNGYFIGNIPYFQTNPYGGFINQRPPWARLSGPRRARTACALVPPKPKEDKPICRCRCRWSQQKTWGTINMMMIIIYIWYIHIYIIQYIKLWYSNYIYIYHILELYSNLMINILINIKYWNYNLKLGIFCCYPCQAVPFFGG